ncbi:MAG: hypothetical protein COZ18_13270 [Flexibacter sp. CG_4_10_14_3_um_filter_32_15]|nr:MAG: hypothetical protein COZ18_13270 [Flexibacter sp. CG_4_10_14_3_um_filter_32_15]
MKSLLRFFLIVFIFIALEQSSSAQCPATCTITISTANGNLNGNFNTNGEVVCIIDGTFTGSVNSNGTTTICVSDGATYSGGINTNNTTIINRGNWTSSMNLQTNSSFLNTGTGTVNIAGGINVANNCSFISDNENTVSISGTLGNGNGGTIQINGPANIAGAINVGNNSTTTFGGQTNISGNVTSSGQINFNADATINGTLSNNSGAGITITDAIVTVTGNFINGSNAGLQAGGSCGRINVGESSTNNSNGNVGTNNIQIDICDATADKGPPDYGFDNQSANASNFGDNISYCLCPTLLPITLTKFIAKKEDNNRVAINWQTVWEMDNEYFLIERSVFGTDFNVIAQIFPQKNDQESNTERNYSFVDNLTDNSVSTYSQNSIIYYRLKQVDTNGNFSYSPVVSVRVEKLTSETINVLFLQNEWKFELQNPVQVKVYSSIGVLKGIYDLNQNQHIISASVLPKGMYILHVKDSKTGKITILKTIR